MKATKLTIIVAYFISALAVSIYAMIYAPFILKMAGGMTIFAIACDLFGRLMLDAK